MGKGRREEGGGGGEEGRTGKGEGGGKGESGCAPPETKSWLRHCFQLQL